MVQVMWIHSIEDLLVKFLSKQLDDGTLLLSECERGIACTAHLTLNGNEYAMPAILLMRYRASLRLEGWRLAVLLLPTEPSPPVSKYELAEWAYHEMENRSDIYLSTPQTGRTPCFASCVSYTHDSDGNYPSVALFEAEVPDDSPLRELIDAVFWQFHSEEVQL